MRRIVIALAASFLICASLFAARPGVWLDVPFVEQQTDGCGAASISMVMQYWARQSGRSPDEHADAVIIQRALYSRQARGIFASEMAKYFREHGFQVFVFSGRWNDLELHLVKGRPLIVGLKPSAGALHYVVVAGIDRDVVMVNDPAQRKLLKCNRSDFGRQWDGTANWTLLAVPQRSGD